MIRARVVRTLLAGLIAASAVSVAQAYVVSGGTGSGTGATGTVSAITLSVADVTDELYPGQTAGVSLTATNPNGTRVLISSLVLDTSQGTGGFGLAAGGAGCPLTAFSYTTQNNGGDGWTVPANGSLSIMLSDAVAASTSTANSCQGGILNVYLKAT